MYPLFGYTHTTFPAARIAVLIVRVKPFGSQPPSSHDVPAGPFDIGRSVPADGVPRCVVLSDPSVSRNHARIEEAGDGTCKTVPHCLLPMSYWLAKNS